MGVGANIDKILREKNISVAELSRRSGVPAGTLYAAIKRDTKSMDSAALSNIAYALNERISTIDPSVSNKVHGDWRASMLEFGGIDSWNALNALLRDNGYVFYETNHGDNDLIIGKDKTYSINSEDLELVSKAISDYFKPLLQLLLSKSESMDTINPDSVEELGDLLSYYEDLHANLEKNGGK